MHIQVEREIPGIQIAVQHGAVVHIAGTVEQNVDGADLLCQRDDIVLPGDVQAAGRCASQAGKRRLIEVGGDYRGTLGKKSFCCSRPMPWPAAVMTAVLPAKRPSIAAPRRDSVAR